MSLATNVVKRKGSANYYVRLGVPLELQPLYRKVELWKSLSTSDAREARSRAAPILAGWHREFDEARKLRAPTPEDLRAMTWSHYEGEVAHHEANRVTLPSPEDAKAAGRQLLADIRNGTIENPQGPLAKIAALVDFEVMRDARQTSREWRTIRLETLRRHVAEGEIGTVRGAVDELLQREGFVLDPGSLDYRMLSVRFLRAEIEALQRAEEQDRGDFTGTPRDPAIVPPKGQSAKHAAPGETILELYDRFQREKTGRATADTWKQNRAIMQLLVDFVGERSPVTGLTRKAIRDWKAALFQWPVKASDNKAFAGMSFRKVIEHNRMVGRPTLSPKTINKYLSAVSPFADWLKAHDYLDINPVEGQLLDINKREQKRFPFTSDQLVKIFSSPLYTGCASDGAEHKPGNVRIADWRAWLPLLSLFTGAGLGELAQLLIDDVKEMHGRWVLHITTEGSAEKSLKTEGSHRVVPLHPELIRIGFLAYVRKVKAASETQLFPEIRPDARGFFSGDPSRFFQRYLARIGVKVDKLTTFHSFRHSAVDAFRRAGIDDSEFKVLLGHAKATTTDRYGVLQQGTIARRAEMIEALVYPGLDLGGITM